MLSFQTVIGTLYLSIENVITPHDLVDPSNNLCKTMSNHDGSTTPVDGWERPSRRESAALTRYLTESHVPVYGCFCYFLPPKYQ